MGLGMAINLQKHLTKTAAPSLQYHHRTMSRGEPLEAIGGAPCKDVADLAAKSDIIFLSLSDDSALESTLHRLVEADLSGKVVVDTSTVHPASTETARARLAGRGARLVAAPVFGASPVAAQGKLLFVLAGPGDAIQAISPFLVGVMGRGVIRLGEDARQSSLLKTAG